MWWIGNSLIIHRITTISGAMGACYLMGSTMNAANSGHAGACKNELFSAGNTYL